MKVVRNIPFPDHFPTTSFLYWASVNRQDTCETRFGKALHNPGGRVDICNDPLGQMLSNISCVRLVLVFQTSRENIWDPMLVLVLVLTKLGLMLHCTYQMRQLQDFVVKAKACNYLILMILLLYSNQDRFCSAFKVTCSGRVFSNTVLQFSSRPNQFAKLRNCFSCPTLWSKYFWNSFFSS